MTQQPHERSETEEENVSTTDESVKRFSVLTKRLLKVPPNELKEEEEEHKHRNDTEK